MIILGTNSIKDTGYDVANSCRFNSGSSDYLQWNSSPAGNRQKFTFSIWFKRAKLGVTQVLASASYSGSDEGYLYISSGDTLEWDSTNSGDGDMFSSMKLRDTSAWYHLVWSVDTTQASAGNRMKFYLNGTQMTAWSTETQPNVNQSLYWNVGGTYYPYIGRRHSGDYFDGYMAEVVQVNNAQLAADSFGEFDDSGIWKPLESVADLTFGDTGYYLNFQDSSALGNDVSGENHDWTSNNLTAIDQSTDTCTNNAATWNSLYDASNLSYAQGNTEISCAADGWFESGATIGISTGKWYFEIKCTLGSGTYSSESIKFGIKNSEDINDGSGEVSQNNGNFYQADGNSGNNGSLSGVGTFATFTTGDIVGCAVDMTNRKIYYHKNGTYINSGNPSTGSNGFDISSSFNFVLPTISMYESGTKGEVNFGSPSFAISSGNQDADGFGNMEFAVPSGYFCLNSKNLAEYG